ncbi:response regulator [Hydrogenibacillus sp. N12]|nr:response regulator [Hydrogenibacillus sp. N12]
MKMMKIKGLIVDDEPVICKGLRYTFPWDQLNIEVIGEAHDGAEALDFIRDHPVDLVITDIVMPRLDGLGLVKILHEEMPSVQVVMISGYEEFAYARQAIRYGVKDYFTKPVDLDELFERLIEIAKEIIVQKRWENDISMTVKERGTQGIRDSENGSDAVRPVSRSRWLVEKAKRYVAEHYHEEIKVRDLAGFLQITPNYFSLVFKQETGKGFNAFLNEFRIEKAKRLLRDSTLRVFEIAEKIKSSIMCKLPSSANERTGHSGIHNVQHGRLSGFLLFLLPLPILIHIQVAVPSGPRLVYLHE